MEYSFDINTLFCCDNNDSALILAADCMKSIIECGYKVHVVNYYGSRILEKFPEVIRNNVVWENACSADYKNIESIIDQLNEKDVLFLLGAERLVPSIGMSHTIEVDFDDKSTRIHNEEDENWDQFCKKLDRLYKIATGKIRGLLIFTVINRITEQKIGTYLKESDNMSISSLRHEETQSENIQRKIHKAISDKSLQINNVIDMIEENRIILGGHTCRYLKAMAYKVSGNLQQAVNILLTENPKNLNDYEKLLLAECYYLDKRGSVALEMLENMYKEDPHMRGLAQTLIRACKGTEKEGQWIKKLYQTSPNDIGVMEAYGSIKSNQGDHKTAAQVFRKLSSMVQGYYYELVACMNDVCEYKINSAELVWQYLYHIINYEPKLNNEVVLRSAYYFKNQMNDNESALLIMDHADLSMEAPKVQELVTLKMELLKDPVVTARFKSDIGSSQRKCKALLEGMMIGCRNELYYSRWREYMESSMLDEEWNTNLYQEFLHMISAFSKVDYEKEIENSYLNECEVYIEALREFVINGGYAEGKYLSDDEINESIIRGAKIWSKEVENSEPWVDYYSSLLLSYRGNYQFANNYAISLFRSAGIYQNKNMQKLCGYLGLLAWGNNQFRLGRESEGLACILSAFMLAREIHEFIPFLENGVAILAKYFIQKLNNSNVRNEEKEAAKKFMNVFSTYSSVVADSLEDPYSLIVNLLPILRENDKLPEYKLQCALKLVNGISLLGKTEISKAKDIVKSNGDLILEVISSRKDILPSTCIMFIQILWSEKKEELICLQIYKYFKRAISVIEESRMVFHQEERSSVTQNATKIYQFYLKFLVFQRTLNKEKLTDVQNIEDEIFICVQKILPRTLEEQNVYNNESKISKEEKEKFKYYLKLFEEYRIKRKTERNNKETLYNIEQELAVLTEELKDHPYFAPLTTLNTYNIDQVQEKLTVGEGIIQFICLDSICILVFITEKKFTVELIIDKDFEKQVKLYTDLFRIKGKRNKYQELSDNLTNKFFTTTYGFIKENQIRKVYLLPDFDLGDYTVGGSRFSNEFFIDLVDSVIHIANYSILWRKPKRQAPEYILNKIYGEIGDTALDEIQIWLENVCSEDDCMKQVNDDNYSEFLEQDKKMALIVYGHGLHKESRSISKGAIGIGVGSRTVYVEDILKRIESRNLSYFLLMSCSGGMPIGKNPEINRGSWTQMFERLRGGIISCRWDVSVRSVCFFLSSLLKNLNNGEDMDVIFLKTVKATKKEYKNLDEWAGFEYWEN